MCEEKPYNEKSDVWALGCVLYEMCTFKHPFDAHNQGALLLKIIKGKYDPLNTKIYTTDLINIVDSCLNKDYNKRPSAKELLGKPIIVSKA